MFVSLASARVECDEHACSVLIRKDFRTGEPDLVRTASLWVPGSSGDSDELRQIMTGEMRGPIHVINTAKRPFMPC